MHPDNLLQPAYPVSIAVDDKNNSLVDSRDQCAAGFTKLEKASIMIAAGILANSPDWSEKDLSINWVAVNSVKYAKAVLEEANK